MSSVEDKIGTLPEPELLQVVMHQRHSKAADVYSFGIVLWELMTWQVPWDDYNQFQVHFSLHA